MSNENNLAIVADIPNSVQAELLRGLLEANGIPAILSEQSAARAIGLANATMANVQILVREEHAEEARQLLSDFDKGLFSSE